MKKALFFLFITLVACQDTLITEADSRSKNTYYQSEIFPDQFKNIYGSWRLVSISGGFSGQGYEKNFDLLEIKEFGIYSIIKENSRIENGKIEVDSVSLKSDYLQINFVPDTLKSGSLLGTFSQRMVDVEKSDKLNLVSLCCDAYDHHFERVK